MGWPSVFVASLGGFAALNPCLVFRAGIGSSVVRSLLTAPTAPVPLLNLVARAVGVRVVELFGPALFCVMTIGVDPKVQRLAVQRGRVPALRHEIAEFRSRDPYRHARRRRIHEEVWRLGRGVDLTIAHSRRHLHSRGLGPDVLNECPEVDERAASGRLQLDDPNLGSRGFERSDRRSCLRDPQLQRAVLRLDFLPLSGKHEHQHADEHERNSDTRRRRKRDCNANRKQRDPKKGKKTPQIHAEWGV